MVAALRGGAGKTILTLGLIAQCHSRGMDVRPFKKGPDYIDAAWHERAAGLPCRNLDTFMMGRDAVAHSFWRHARGGGLAIVEGNRGLYDGVDAEGTHSTAELAKLIEAPVVLVVDCSKATRTIAASVLGCQRLDPDVVLAGVVLNRVAGARHERVIRAALKSACGLRVFGAIPRDAALDLPERHLGLVPPQEHGVAEGVIAQAGAIVAEHIDLDGLAEVAAAAPAHEQDAPLPAAAHTQGGPRCTIAVVRDGAFQFYYPENLEALEGQGARIVEVSALRDECLPDVDGLYIGGGFPETHAQELAGNRPFAESVLAAVEDGIPVMAECAGLMYLGESIEWHGEVHRMVGALPLNFAMAERPHGHGYTMIRCDGANPFYRDGIVLRGHEFHYSQPETPLDRALKTAFHVERGHGLDGGRDGVVYRNVLATYSHVHALGAPEWAESFVCAAAHQSGSV